MNDYRLTLNLPETEFPMRGNLVNRELKILESWKDNGIYHRIRAARKGRKIFILHDGPPYANGKIHIGHSVNKILKDMIVKSKGLSGFDAPYIPGWDCHGLPIELKVEQDHGPIGEKLNAMEFCLKCREYAITQVDSQRKDFIRLGVLGDWENSYLTMDFKTEANIIRTLGKIIENGQLYKGEKPVYWCIDCRSALAEAEVEYYEKTSFAIDVKFKAINQEAIKAKFKLQNFFGSISLVVWTTTPWTLPANRAISVSSKFKYSLVQLECGDVLILAKNLVEKVTRRAKISSYNVLSNINGEELEMLYFKHPFLNLRIPVILNDDVIQEMGTGAVHIAGGHSPEDYDISKNHGLEIASPVGIDGRYLTGTHPSLDGINSFQANTIIVKMLNNIGALLHVENIQHSYPCCWRHKTPIIFRVTPQWFLCIDYKGMREKSLKEVQNVKWIPLWGKSHIELMVKNRPDWCISRQRIWGIPIPLFIHKETGALHPRTLELIEEVAQRVEVNGAQEWWNLDPHNLIGKNSSLYEKVTDTLDVWFDSGSTHFSVVEMRSEFSGNNIDMYLEGHDQYRGWFMSSLMISTAIKGRAPYNQVLTHGFTVDGQGRKMSKSIGNIITPQEITNKFGADILRLWVASTDYTSEMSISDEILKHIADSYRRIRNTTRFLLGNLKDFNPNKDMVKTEQMIVLDRWAISCAKSAQKNIVHAYEAYHFHEVVKNLMHFCSINMGSFYLNVIKDRLYTAKSDSLIRRSCQTALYHILEALVRWIAPILSFTASEIWDFLPMKREKYVFISEWYEGLFGLSKSELMNDFFWKELLKVRDEVNKVIEISRIDKRIKSSLEAEITLYVEKDLLEKLSALGQELRFIFLTSDIKVMNYSDSINKSYQSKLIKGLKISLNKAHGKKCQRCWHYTTDVGSVIEYEDICKRCISNIIGNGEKRRFV